MDFEIMHYQIYRFHGYWNIYLFIVHGDTHWTGMNMKVWNMQNKDQVPQEKP